MSTDTPPPPEPQPPPTSQPHATAALEELWRLADQLSAAVRAHLDRRVEPSHQNPRPHPPESDR
ncbi:hypothetical protein [Streptomyces sp. NBRC 110028]|uniref:hypothetical protein n=1 Tax=Streptomyces sp. NBRC 110028 TaxID=1621260 RepID=UPI000B265107|nr:hypothetical protein [Streptomyces sp. NBRC 110028]